jgi:hypothetical protein
MEIWIPIIVAVITGGCTLIGTVNTNRKLYNNTVGKLHGQFDVQNEKVAGEIALINNEIQILNTNVSKHNQVIDRTYKLELAVRLLEEQQKNQEEKIKQLLN